MKKDLISVIIPAYNEEKVLYRSLKAIENKLLSMKQPFEILVVNDGSKDATLDIIKKLIKEKKRPYLKVVSYKDGPSRRENLAKSFKLLKGNYILLLDMDVSMDLKHLEEMVYWLEKGFPIVIANRYHKDSRTKKHPKRYIISKIYNAVIRLLFQTGLRDNICGFKAFKKGIILKLVKESGEDKTRTRSVFWDTELLIRARCHKIRIKEIPVCWQEAEKSALNFKREIKMVPYIIKFWMNFSRKKH